MSKKETVILKPISKSVKRCIVKMDIIQYNYYGL